MYILLLVLRYCYQRTILIGNRCILSGSGTSKILCVSSFQCYQRATSENSGRQSCGDLRTPGQADSGLVFPSDANVPTTTCPVKTGENTLVTAQLTRANTPNAQSTESILVCLLSGKIQKKLGLPSGTVDIILASWRGSTCKQYNSFLSRWLHFCQTNNIVTDTAGVHEGLTFLTHLFEQGLGYSALNTARSALSALGPSQFAR